MQRAQNRTLPIKKVCEQQLSAPRAGQPGRSRHLCCLLYGHASMPGCLGQPAGPPQWWWATAEIAANPGEFCPWQVTPKNIYPLRTDSTPPPRRPKLRHLYPPALAAVIQTDRQVVQYTSRYSKERRLNLRRRGVCCPTCLFCKDIYSLGDTVRVVGTMQADRSGHSLFFPCFRANSKILPNSRIDGNR